MLLKKILILPVFAFGIAAFFNLIVGDFFLFTVWCFLTMLSFLIVYPIMTNKKDKVVPVFQAFFSLLGAILFASIIAILDFVKVGTYSVTESVVFGSFFGLGFVALVMVIKGKGEN